MRDYAGCAARGLTQAQTARELGVSRSAVAQAAKRLRLTFVRSRRATPENASSRRGHSLTAAHRAKISAGVRMSWAKNGDPRRHVRDSLTVAEHRDYLFLKVQHGYTRAEALRAIGRGDLL